MSRTSEHLVLQMHRYTRLRPGVTIRLSAKNIGHLEKDNTVIVGRYPGFFNPLLDVHLPRHKDELGYEHTPVRVQTVFEPELDLEVYDG